MLSILTVYINYPCMFTKKSRLPIEKNLFLSLISGSEAGIATTTAIIAGLVTGTNDRSVVIASAFVTLVVQAFNSGVGHVTTSHTDDEIDHNPDMDKIATPASEAFMQFLVHIAASFLVLIPIVFMEDLNNALVASILVCLGMLFTIGFTVGVTVRHTPLRNGTITAVLGALVVIIGFGAGYALN